MQNTEANKDAATEAKPTKDAGWAKRHLGEYNEWSGTIKAHPVKGVLLALGLFLLGIGGDEIKDQIKSRMFGPDEFLAQLAEKQKEGFADLNRNLGMLRGSIGSGDKAAFASVQNAVKGLEDSNSQLIQQLVLAKQENETLRKVTEQKTGLSGGYDFILAEDNGIRIDDSTVIGLKSVSGNYAHVSLTSADRDASDNMSLQSGQSLGYRNAAGKLCKVSLLSINRGNPGTASFALGCT